MSDKRQLRKLFQQYNTVTSSLPFDEILSVPMSTHHHWTSEPVPVADQVEIREQLESVLQSAPFRTSRQCQDLFRYMVEHTLDGAEESLRERVIGIEVFGRAPDYDTAEDPVVRLRAADIRKRLAQYYQAKNAAPGTWKIDIPTGSYRAHFQPPEVAPSQVTAGGEKPQPAVVLAISDSAGIALQPQPEKRKVLFWSLILLAACLMAVLTGWWVTRTVSHPKTAFELFWEPILENSSPVLVCTGSNRVYILSLEARSRYRKSHPLPQDATPNMETLVPKEDLRKFTSDDFIPMMDTYLTIGDASVTSQVSSLLTSHHHAYDLRFGSDLSFGDLREGSAVLIGAFNNNWTLSMTDNLRFVFEQGDTAQMHVKDRFDASRSWWPKFSNGKFSEDYAIVSRVLDSKTGSAILTIAGLDHTGTRAAGDFVTNPQVIADLVRQAPQDWNRKNLQVLLHTHTVNGIPSAPTVVATHYW